MKLDQTTNQAIKTLVSGIFKFRDGSPFEITDGQCDIFEAVTNPFYKWVWTSAPTRYGKSETIALAVLTLVVLYHLKVPIVAGSEEKARKIMEYMLQHISDNPIVYSGLLNTDIDKVERLKVQMSKQGLRWSTGGWTYVTSVDSRNIIKEGEGVVGEGGDVIILEEAGLIKRKEQFSKVVRMVEGDWGKLVMSGNCIENSIFEEAYNDPLYYKVKISLQQAIDEGRMNRERLEQQKKQTTSKDWKRYYEVEFPNPSDYGYFKPQKYDYLPLEMLYVGAVDLSLGEAKKGSKIGIAILGVDEKGQVYEVESFEEQISPDEAMKLILNYPYEFHRFGVETVQFQKYFMKEMDRVSKEKGKYIPFVGITQQRKKEERIEGLEPLINTAQIKFKGVGPLWNALSKYPDIEYLDVLDALEMAWRLAKLANNELGAVSRTKPEPKYRKAPYIIDPSKFR